MICHNDVLAKSMTDGSGDVAIWLFYRYGSTIGTILLYYCPGDKQIELQKIHIIKQI